MLRVASDSGAYGAEGLIIDEQNFQRVDLIQLVLLDVAYDTHLPEIFEIFGGDSVLKFLEIFAGTTIEIPSREVLERAIRDITVYIQMQRASLTEHPRVVMGLASQYDLTTTRVREIARDMEEKFKQYKMKGML